MFKFLYGGYYISDPKKLGAERVAEHYEIELSPNDGGISCFNGIAYERRRGDVFFAKKGDTRKSRRNFECYYVHFECRDAEFCEKYIDVLPPVIRFADYDETKSIIDRICPYRRQHICRSCR